MATNWIKNYFGKTKNKPKKETKSKIKINKTKVNKIKTTKKNKPTKIFKSKNTTWPHQETSMSTFQNLRTEGYNRVTFEPKSDACNVCKKIGKKTWTLQKFIDSTKYNAPIFSHIHVNCSSPFRVWDKNDELPDIMVDWTGEAF